MHVNNIKSVLLIVGSIMMISSMLFSQGIGDEFLSNRFTRPEVPVEIISKFTTQDYEKVGDSGILELYIDKNSTSMRVLDKRSGYVWGDVLTDTDAYNEMNDVWKNIAKSLVMIEYFDDRGISSVVGSASPDVKKTWKVLKNGASCTLNFEPVSISFTVFVEIFGDKLVFSLDQKTISEKDKYTLASVIFAPFLGSTIADEINGYAFVPDGPGALIRFSRPAHYLNWFEKRVYGKDYSIENLVSVNDLRANRPNDFLREEPTVLVPAFGVVHGVKKNAIFGVITSGAEYSAIISYPSGILSSYNWTSAKFIYRQKYLQPTSRSGAGIQVAQKEMNKFNARLELVFLTGDQADYVGMAKYYREAYSKQIFGEKPTKKEYKTKDIPLYLTVLVSDIEKQLIGQKVVQITSVENIKAMSETLSKSGVGNLVFLLKGWEKGGVNGNKINSTKVEPKFGEIDDIAKFALEHSAASGKSFELYFVTNTTRVTEKQLNLKNEVGLNLSQSLIFEERDNKDLWLYRSYYTKIDLSSRYLVERIKELNRNNIKNIAIEEFANKLYGHLKRDEEIYRSDARKLVEKTLSDVKNQGNNLILFVPNVYSWKYMKTFGNIPMNSSQYLFETDTVPFLQIVLSGNVVYFTPYMNNGFFSDTDVLKSIDFGAYPSFIVSWLDNASLKDTPLWDYPSTRFADWKSKIVEIYKKINGALKYVRGSKIIDRTVIHPGFVRVDYENGYSILVNYTEERVKFGNVVVEPVSYRVVKVVRNGVDGNENK
ncbi:hypothetical protein SAMN02745226_00446 [Fervidobacterium gondwanense DSM 13020]|uniref:Uncharacterized protein n=2 Tax=Fervidobacterium gondwanense TaxID=44754 RepID=A0A1M7S460_FERGO|nr:hypothetical protein SAMN02745226_00446 [Fervidobacterium gondwanense DSM 13020]